MMSEWDAREIKAIVCETVKQTAPEAVRETLEHFGVDVSRPHETQADMHYLRKLRKGRESVESYLRRSIWWAMLCGAGVLAWEAAKIWLKRITKGE